MTELSVVLPRLRLATDAELEQLENVLELKHCGDPEERRVHIKEAYFKAARTDGDYRKSLLAVVEKVSETAEWKKPEIKDSSDIEWIEEYIVRTLIFIHDPSKAEMLTAETAKRREHAEASLEGNITSPAELSLTDAAIEIAAAAGAGALAVAFFPWVLGITVTLGLIGWWLSPAMRLLLPATLILIHIRKRHEFEGVLERESAA